MKPLKKLKLLYAQIPTFECKEGCTDCCGPVPFAKAEWEIIRDKREGKDINCPYSLAGKCDIYEQRPFMCHLFGTSNDPHLACPHGCKPKIPLTSEKAKALTDEYIKLILVTGHHQSFCG